MSLGSDRSSTNCIFPRPARVVRGERECVPAAPSSPPPRAPISFSEPPDRSPSPVEKPAWNMPPNGSNEAGPVMGADSWPPLSESNRVSPISSSSDTQGHPMLATYKYDEDKVREIFARMFIVHEYPFRMVEHQFFVLFCKALNPKFELIERVTLRNDCMKIFAIEKQKLRSMLRNVDRISLTADLWTSNQTIGYICLTGHFLDSEWKLQKRILNFYSLALPHTGITIADCILQCLTEWGIEDKVFTITLDNASSNDTAIKVLRDNFASKGKLYFNGKIFHVRCCAHVLNLMVQDGLAEIQDVIENIRESVKYLKMSPSRFHKFNEIVKQLKLSTSKILQLDVPTRWNSTYEMLESALEFKPVFSIYKERDSNYKWLLSEEDWIRATEVSQFLEVFNEATEVFSGRQYPTSNLFLTEFWRVKNKLNDMSFDTRDFVMRMTRRMNEKFEKYWEDCNLLMAIGAVLDPRYKMWLIIFCFPKIYGVDVFQRHIDDVREALDMLYKAYVSSEGQINVSASNITSTSSKLKRKRRANDDFYMWAEQQRDVIPTNKTELDIYLEEDIYRPSDEGYDKFDALSWWKANTLKFRYLSKMARDILSIPITTVASEAAFSAGGRVLDQYRSSLKPETVQALICTGDWLHHELGLEQSSNINFVDKPCTIVMRLQHWERKKCKPNSLPILHKMHVKVGDTVKIISGHEQGKIGEITRVFRHNSTVIVKDMNLKTKHMKSREQGEPGQIVKIEAPIHSSNVMLYSKEKQLASRVGHKILEDVTSLRLVR